MTTPKVLDVLLTQERSGRVSSEGLESAVLSRRVGVDYSSREVGPDSLSRRVTIDCLFPQSGLDSPWRGKEGEEGKRVEPSSRIFWALPVC